MTEAAFPRVDIALSRRLERAEATSGARFIESRARTQPDIGACWMEAGGAYAMFDGVGSPLTQTFGLGMFEPITADVLGRIEQFFASRGSATFHEISPLADQSALALLADRGYRPCELTSVMFQPLPARTLDDTAVAASPFRVKVVEPADRKLWADTAYRGWSEFLEVREFVAAFGPTAIAAENAVPFLVVEGETPVATGSLSVHDGVALFAGASTIPEARGRGAQRTLLDARLRVAASQGCTIAMMCAAPGSASQRNAERSGFRIAYTRIKWHRPT
jgi:hypothetical protein